MITTLEAYAKLRGQLSARKLGRLLPELKEGGLAVEGPEHITDPQILWQRVVTFAADQGWLCFPSVVHHFFAAKDLPAEGRVLHGEFCKENRSLHIRPHPLGGWQVNTLIWEPEGSGFLMEESSLLSVESDVKEICYQVFWQRQPETGYCRRLARFVGLKQRDRTKSSEVI